RAPRGRFPDQAQRVRRHHGAVGLGQVYLDEPRRLPRYADRRRVLAQRPEGERPLRQRSRPHPQQGDRVRLPDVQPAPPRGRAAQRRAAAHLRRQARARAPGAGHRRPGACRPRRPHAPQTQRAVRRPAPARGDRPGSRQQPQHPPRRRADGQPRFGHGRGEHAALRRAVAQRADHRPGDARTRHRRARAPPDPPARRQGRARRTTGSETVKRYLLAAAAALTPAGQFAREDTLYKAQAVTQQEYENARVTLAQARAALVNAQANLSDAQIAYDQARVTAPVAGTIIQKNVELGTVISSPARDVGGGTVLFQMANLDTVQVQSMVDETDIGKVQPGLPVTITVDAFPNRPFQGTVLKLEPQATQNQNLTMF